MFCSCFCRGRSSPCILIQLWSHEVVHPCWVGGWGVCRCHGGHESLFSVCYHMEATSITVRVGRFGMFGCSLVVVLSVLDPNIVRGPEVVFPSLLGCLRCVGCVVS